LDHSIENSSGSAGAGAGDGAGRDAMAGFM
jgi:hypothetical protein